MVFHTLSRYGGGKTQEVVIHKDHVLGVEGTGGELD